MGSISDELTFREMSEHDLIPAIECFASVGLYESLSTLTAFYKYDPKGFYVAIRNSDNQLIGCCGSPVTTHSSGYLGLYGVKKEFQNKGVGKILFNMCLKYIGDRNCGLSSVPEKLLMYRMKAGFNVSDGQHMVVMEGIPENLDNLNDKLECNLDIKLLSDDNHHLINKVIEYDIKVHNDNREKLLRLTFSQTDYKTLVIFNKSNHQIVGFGCIRSAYPVIYMLGPIYADNDDLAEILIKNLIKSSNIEQNMKLSFMTISTPDNGVKIGQKLGLIENVRCQMLYTKIVIPTNYSLIYCLHSPNFSL